MLYGIERNPDRIEYLTNKRYLDADIYINYAENQYKRLLNDNKTLELSTIPIIERLLTPFITMANYLTNSYNSRLGASILWTSELIYHNIDSDITTDYFFSINTADRSNSSGSGFAYIIREIVKNINNVKSSNDHDYIFGYILIEVDRLKKTYPEIWNKYKAFLGGVLVPLLLDYDYLFDSIIYHSMKDINISFISKDYVGCGYNSNRNISSYYYILMKMVLKAPPDMYLDFSYNWLKPQGTIDIKYIQKIALCGLPKDSMKDGYKLISPSIPIIASLFTIYMIDKNIYIDKDGAIYTDEDAKNKFNEIIKKTMDSLPENHPVKKSPIVGTCAEPLKDKDGNPMTQDGLDGLLDLLDKLKKEKLKWQKLLDKQSSYYKTKRMNKIIGLDKWENATPQNMESYISGLEDELVKLQKKAEETGADEDAWKKKYEELKIKYDKLKLDYEQCMKDLAACLEALKKYEEELARLRAQQTQIQPLIDERDALKKKIAELEKENADLREQLRLCKLELEECKKMIAYYESQLELIMKKVNNIYTDAEKLKARDMKITAIENVNLNALEESVAMLLSTVVGKEGELKDTLAKVKDKIDKEILPGQVKVDLDKAVYEAFLTAKQNEDFYYKLVDDITRMLATNLRGKNKVLLGQAIKTDICNNIMETLNKIHDIINNFGITGEGTDQTAHDRLNEIIRRIDKMKGDIDNAAVASEKSRGELIDEFNNITKLLELKISEIVGNLPNREDIIYEIMRRVKEMQLYYLKNAVLAIQTLQRRLFAPRSVF